MKKNKTKKKNEAVEQVAIEPEETKRIFTAGVITINDDFAHIDDDISGQLLDAMLKDRGFDTKYYITIPSDMNKLEESLTMLSDEIKLDIVFTIGGVGFSSKDVTPEATRYVIDREAPGICEALRYYELQFNPRAMLTRGVSGIRKNTLIINLPGDVQSVARSFESIVDTLYEGLVVLNDNVSI